MEKDAINQRVIQVINYLVEQKIVNKKSELADKLGCSPQTITEILGERQGVKTDLLQKFFDVFNISYDFIFKGTGPIQNQLDADPEFSASFPVAIKNKDAKKEILKRLSAKYNEPVPIPMADISVAAGSGSFNSVQAEDVECIQMPGHMLKGGFEYLCVRIKGISMMPTLQDGGYLIVRLLDRSEWKDIRDNHIYIVTDREGRAFVKRVKNRLKEHGLIVCVSDNPDKMAFPGFNLTEDEINTVWYVEWYFTPKMPNIHETYYNKVGQLEESYNELREEFEQFRNIYFELENKK